MSLPVQLAKLKDQPVLVAGAGKIATEKAKRLMKTGAQVHVVTLETSAEFDQLEPQPHTVRKRALRPEDAAGMALVLAATNDREANRAVVEFARRQGTLAAAIDDPDYCDFYGLAEVERGPATISIGTNGASPLLAAQLRRFLETILPDELTPTLDFFREIRQHGFKGLKKRSSLLRALADPTLSAAVDSGDKTRAIEKLRQISRENECFVPGMVSVIGAGPGAEDLLTVRALRRIQSADIILHDALVTDQVLSHASPNARLINVGRRCKRGNSVENWLSAEEGLRLLVKEAGNGLKIARLHAGDPFVFGRGGNEIDALSKANVPYEIVPGISSVLSAAAEANVPLTCREEASGFSVRTGHSRKSYTQGELPPHEETVCVLMGLGALGDIAKSLVKEGRSPKTPAVVVSNSSRPDKKMVTGTLDTIASAVNEADIQSPATLIAGPTAYRAAQSANTAALPEKFCA